MEFDLDAIKEAGYPVISPVIITNSEDYTDVVVHPYKNVTCGDEVIHLL